MGYPEGPPDAVGGEQRGLIGIRFMSVTTRLADAGEPAFRQESPARARYRAIPWKAKAKYRPFREATTYLLVGGDDDVDVPRSRIVGSNREAKDQIHSPRVALFFYGQVRCWCLAGMHLTALVVLGTLVTGDKNVGGCSLFRRPLTSVTDSSPWLPL